MQIVAGSRYRRSMLQLPRIWGLVTLPNAAARLVQMIEGFGMRAHGGALLAPSFSPLTPPPLSPFALQADLLVGNK